MNIDRQTIRALSAETRIRILKILHGSRRIAADISKEMGLAPSTVNEHLKMMEDAGLVKKNDTGHKWIYYEITEKGKNMITPKMPISIILTLSLGIGLALFGGISLLAADMFYSGGGAAVQSTVSGIMEKAAETAGQGTVPAGAAPAASWLPPAILAAGAALVIFSVIRLRRK